MTKLRDSNCDKTQKLKLWQNSKTHIVTKVKVWQNSNGDKNQIVKKKSKATQCDKTQTVTTQIVTKFMLWQNSNGDKNQILKKKEEKN